MIPPSNQWCQQIDVTNLCALACSNCTRLLLHATKDTRYYISTECFEKAVISLKDFPLQSGPDAWSNRRKVVGIIGGEPLLHPQFPELVDIICKHIPDVRHRGLWTSKDWTGGKHPKWGPYKPHVEKLIGKHYSRDTRGPYTRHKGGYLNWNMHTEESNTHHGSVLVAIKDLVPDEKKRWEMIEKCQYQLEWSSSTTDKGFFFCEVAAHHSRIFNLGLELPSEPGVWKHDLQFIRDANGVPRPQGPYAAQILGACERCGGAAPTPPRRDKEEQDDISHSNFVQLQALNSPAVRRGAYVLWDEEQCAKYNPDDPANDKKPLLYMKGKRSDDQAAAAAREKAEREATNGNNG